jgi:ELP3 family radical SAM enzyme/protein acetyltransferase
MCDIEDVGTSKIVKPFNLKIDYATMRQIVNEMIHRNIVNKDDMTLFIKEMRKKHHVSLGNIEILFSYRIMCEKENIPYKKSYELFLQKKSVRSQSGVIVYPAAMTPMGPNQGCAWNCKFCPKVVDEDKLAPRSYSTGEQGIALGHSVNYDPVMEVRTTAFTKYTNGHPVDKGEFIVLGGTFDSYDIEYQEWFIARLYYGANTFFDDVDVNKLRPVLSLDEEIKINETALIRIIGLTIETRPDCVKPESIKRYRHYGVTRVQMGIQHINQRILDRADRKCSSKSVIRAIKLLKDNNIKVDGHWMPCLANPLKIGVSPFKKDLEIDDIDFDFDMYEADKEMFDTVTSHPDWQLDQWKIYPLQIVENSQFYEEYMRGLIRLYSEEIVINTHAKLTKKGKLRSFTRLHELLIYVLSKVPEWVRVNRVIRDIPIIEVHGGTKDNSMRQDLENIMADKGIACVDIRSREIKKKQFDIKTVILKDTTYDASGGNEHHLQIVTPENEAIGFLRLRFNSETNNMIVCDELCGCALIRELHIYGQTTEVRRDDLDTESHLFVPQHQGFGTRLLKESFRLAINHGYSKIAVISGIGVKEYYRRFGFQDEGYNRFMIKHFTASEIEENRNIMVPNKVYENCMKFVGLLIIAFVFISIKIYII